jgi:hypothetical protein
MSPDPEPSVQVLEKREEPLDSPYRAQLPVDRSLATVSDGAARIAPAIPAVDSVFKLCVRVFVARTTFAAVFWIYAVRTDQVVGSQRWTLIVSVFALLWWLHGAVRSLARRGRDVMGRALAIEAALLLSGLALIEALPWSSRWWIELCGMFSLAVFVVVAVVYRFVRRAPEDRSST